MSIDAIDGNYPMTQQRFTNISCFLVIDEYHYGKDCPNLTVKLQQYQPIVHLQSLTQTVTASHIVSQSSLVTIIKELAKVKETNQQLRKGIQQLSSKQNPTTQPTAIKLTVT